MNSKINGKLIYTDIPHKYTYNGVVVPAVNDILQQCGISDYSMINKRVMERARAFGKAVHRATHLWDEHNLNEKTLSTPLVPYLTGWKNMQRDNKVKFYEIEKPRYSSLGFAGTPDRICSFNKLETILDAKSTEYLTLANKLQLSGYEIIVSEDNGTGPAYKIRQRIIVRLGPMFKRGYDLYYCKDASDRNGFMSCLNVYHLQTQAKKLLKG